MSPPPSTIALSFVRADICDGDSFSLMDILLLRFLETRFDVLDDIILLSSLELLIIISLLSLFLTSALDLISELMSFRLFGLYFDEGQSSRR